MEHYQEEYKCGVCGNELVVDIISYGTIHQGIRAVTCKKCATHIMGDKKKQIKSPSHSVDVNGQCNLGCC